MTWIRKILSLILVVGISILTPSCLSYYKTVEFGSPSPQELALLFDNNSLHILHVRDDRYYLTEPIIVQETLKGIATKITESDELGNEYSPQNSPTYIPKMNSLINQLHIYLDPQTPLDSGRVAVPLPTITQVHQLEHDPKKSSLSSLTGFLFTIVVFGGILFYAASSFSFGLENSK